MKCNRRYKTIWKVEVMPTEVEINPNIGQEVIKELEKLMELNGIKTNE